MKKNKSRKGFTIVELVIVIAVIAILAAVLIPTFSNVISKANHSAAEQEAKNAYTEYMIEAAGKGEVGTYYVYDAGDGRYVAIENGAVKGVYGSQADAVAAMIPGETYDANELKAATDKTGEKLYGYKLDTIISVPDQGGNGGNGGNSEPPVHTCGNGIVQSGQDATCTDPGWKSYYKCYDCDKLYKEQTCINEITLDTWKNGEGKIEKDSTAHSGTLEWTRTETTHQQKYSCCDHVVVETANHNWIDDTCSECEYNRDHVCVTGTLVEAKTATCTELGWSAYYDCTGCDNYYSDEALKNKINDLDAWKAKNPNNHTQEATWTKTETNHKKEYPCCNSIVVSEESHEWSNGRCTECTYVCTHTGGTATCTEKATCDNCGTAYGNLAPHTPAADDGDCTTPVVCTECSAVTTEALSHTNTDGDVKCDNANCNHVMPSLHLDLDNGAPGKVGTAINLKNDSYSIEYPDPSGNFSASFWIKTGAVPEGKDPVIFTNKNWDTSGRLAGYVLFMEDDRIGFNAGKGTDEQDSISRADFYTTSLPAAFQSNAWFHVVCVVNIEGGTISFSFNGGDLVKADINSNKGTAKLSDMNFENENKLSIGTGINGQNGFSNDGFVNGDAYMDDFMLFDKALTQEEVDTLWAYYN